MESKVEAVFCHHHALLFQNKLIYLSVLFSLKKTNTSCEFSVSNCIVIILFPHCKICKNIESTQTFICQCFASENDIISRIFKSAVFNVFK